LFVIWMCGGTTLVVYMNKLFPYPNPTSIKVDYVIGIISAGSIIVVWVPQIWITYKVKGPKSLSVATLILTAPGSALSIYFMISFGNSLEVWLPNAFSCFFQVILLIMCIYYLYGHKCMSKKDDYLVVNQNEEDGSTRDIIRTVHL